MAESGQIIDAPAWRVVSEKTIKPQKPGVVQSLRKKLFPTPEEKALKEQQEAGLKAEKEAKIKEELGKYIPSDEMVDKIEREMIEAAAAKAK